MEIIDMYERIAAEQIVLLNEYIALMRKIEDFELRINGQISQADLLINGVLKRVDNLTDKEILIEREELYNKIIIRRYAQRINSCNQTFCNALKAAKPDEIEKHFNMLLKKISDVKKEKEYVRRVINLRGDKNNE